MKNILHYFLSPLAQINITKISQKHNFSCLNFRNKREAFRIECGVIAVFFPNASYFYQRKTTKNTNVEYAHILVKQWISWEHNVQHGIGNYYIVRKRGCNKIFSVRWLFRNINTSHASAKLHKLHENRVSNLTFHLEDIFNEADRYRNKQNNYFHSPMNDKIEKFCFRVFLFLLQFKLLSSTTAANVFTEIGNFRSNFLPSILKPVLSRLDGLCQRITHSQRTLRARERRFFSMQFIRYRRKNVCKFNSQ